MERFETEEFILAVQAREPIWLATHPKHKHKKTVNKMWNEIAEQFPDKSKLALKKKWKNLRDSFKRELKKNPESNSRWSYFDLMKFISPYGMPSSEVSAVKAEDMPLIEISSEAHVRYTTVDAIENMVQNSANNGDVEVNVGVAVVDETATLSISNDTHSPMHGNIKQRKRKIRQEELNVVYETTMPTKVVKANELEILIDQPEQQHQHQHQIHHHHQQQQQQQQQQQHQQHHQQQVQQHHHQQQQQQQQQQQVQQQHQIEEQLNTISGANMVEFMVEKNDDYHFFLSLLPQMSKFETLQKLRIRQHIQQIIIDEACMLQNGYTNA